MPNPILLNATPNRGQQPPDRYAPIPEEYQSQEDNRPYIGSIDHGVDAGTPDYNPELDDDFNETDEAEYDVEKDETPIPVRIVSGDSGTEIKDFRIYRTYAPLNNASQIVNRHDNRTALKIKNMGANKVWLGDNASNANPVSGYALDAGAETSVTSTQEVYGVTEVKAASGGWINLIPRQTITSSMTFGDIDLAGYDNGYVAFVIYSLGGTTPNARMLLMNILPDNTSVNNPALFDTAGKTVAARYGGFVDLKTSTIVRPSVVLTGTDPTAEIEALVFAGPYKPGGPNEPTPLAVWADYTVSA